MLKLSKDIKVYVASTAIDFRKAINGLVLLVMENFNAPVNNGDVYVFYNRNYDRIKCIYWDKNGFVLYQKRLERGRFKFGKENNSHYMISQQQLDWLCAGLDFQLMSEFPMLDFSNYF